MATARRAGLKLLQRKPKRWRAAPAADRTTGDPPMTDAAPQTVRLDDYTPPPWLVDKVHLTFRLDPDATRVTARVCPREGGCDAHGVRMCLGE